MATDNLAIGLWAVSECVLLLAMGCANNADDTSDAAISDDDAAVLPMVAPLKVTTAVGEVEGFYEDSNRLFLGIPFAKAPVGELRFAPPQPAEPWEGTLSASDFGPSCPQASGSLSVSNAQNEDCLSLNVFTPKMQSAELRPVMVWIYGGAFVSGGSSQYREATTLSEVGDLLVVTLNYRLGALGFLAHEALDAEGVPSGNAGLRDQQLALRWVHDNIEAFGGDPSRITLFGESAGGASTCYQMFANGSEELAQGFIVESGACLGSALGAKTHADAVALGATLADDLCAGEADVAACLRGLDASALVNWNADASIFGAGWGANVDGAEGLLTDSTDVLAAQGKFNKAPLLLGTNYQEWGLFELIGSPAPTTIDEFNAAIDAQFADFAAAAKDFYAPASDAEAGQAFTDAMTDAGFRCPARALARAADAQGVDVYLYSFEIPPGYHALELDYVFGREDLSQLLGSTKDAALGDAIQGYWTSFAITSNPNGGDRPSWPRYTTADDKHLTLATTIAEGTHLRQDACDFWMQQVTGSP